MATTPKTLQPGVYRASTMGVDQLNRKKLVFDASGNLVELQPPPELVNKPEESPFGKLNKGGPASYIGSAKSGRSALSTGTTVVAFSEHNYPTGKFGGDQGAVFLKMEGKPGITKGNLLMVPLTVFLTMAASTDVIQSLAYLLGKKGTHVYNLDPDQVSKTMSNAASLASFVSIPMILMAGFVYDLLGRKWTIIGLFGISAMATILFPLVGPSVAGFDVVRIMFQVCYVPLLCNPFVNDYVRVQSRGQATGIQNMGMTLGNLFSVAVLFSITKVWENQYLVFGLLAALQVLWILPSYCLISEPVIMDAKEEKRSNKKSLCGKIKSMLKQTGKACKADPPLAIGLFGLAISRNGSMLQQVTFQQWISANEVKYGYNGRDLWQKQNLITNLCALPMVFIVGRLSDKISTKIMVPGCLIFQITVMMAYMFVGNPNSYLGYGCAVFQAASAFTIIVSMQSYTAKRTPKMIRGIINAVIGMVSSVGMIVYLQLAAALSQSYGESWVFAAIAIIDVFVLIVILIAIFTGYYGEEAEDEDAVPSKGSGGKGGYQDIPKLNEVQDQVIPEVDHDLENTSIGSYNNLMASQDSRRSRDDSIHYERKRTASKAALLGDGEKKDPYEAIRKKVSPSNYKKRGPSVVMDTVPEDLDEPLLGIAVGEPATEETPVPRKYSANETSEEEAERKNS